MCGIAKLSIPGQTPARPWAALCAQSTKSLLCRTRLSTLWAPIQPVEHMHVCWCVNCVCVCVCSCVHACACKYMWKIACVRTCARTCLYVVCLCACMACLCHWEAKNMKRARSQCWDCVPSLCVLSCRNCVYMELCDYGIVCTWNCVYMESCVHGIVCTWNSV
jgi:hypothetical protein